MSALYTIAEAERRYDHGTAARYKLAKCRCLPCCRAHSIYWAELHPLPIWRGGYASKTATYYVKNRETGFIVRCSSREEMVATRAKLNAASMEVPPNRLVSPNAVRAHMRWLSENGVGLHQVAKVTGMSYNSLQRIMGYPGRPVRSLRHGNAEKILAVGLSDAAEHGIIDGTETFAYLECLFRAGWTKKRIAEELGLSRQLQIGRRSGKVHMRNARRIKALHDSIVARVLPAALVCSHRVQVDRDATAAARKYYRDRAKAKEQAS